MTEHESVAAFRKNSIRQGGETSSNFDAPFANEARNLLVGADDGQYPKLRDFIKNCDRIGWSFGAESALADYDRLVADRATPTEHPAITTYRITTNEGMSSAENDAAFVRAILSDARVVQYLTDTEQENGDMHEALEDFFRNGFISDERVALDAYDRIVNPEPAQAEQDNNGQSLIGHFQEALDALIECATKLEVAIGKMRRVV